MVDIGTNGEIALSHDGKLTVCSTAAGPAFEGVGISMGMRGETGAVDRVWLDGDELKYHTIGDAEPIGICGSGLVDAAACLLDNEELDETGYLEDDVCIAGDVVLTAKDIRMLQLAKGAVRAGINTALISASVDVGQLDTLYIAGGFGSYLDIASAARIGLIPLELTDKVKVTGNSALGGASMLLLAPYLRDRCSEIAGSAEVLELSSNPVFTNEYMEQMMF